MDILDTNFNFPDMRRIAIQSASAFMLVFSVDDVTSFKEVSDENFTTGCCYIYPVFRCPSFGRKYVIVEQI